MGTRELEPRRRGEWEQRTERGLEWEQANWAITETEKERGMGTDELGNYRNREGEGNGNRRIGKLQKPKGRGEWWGNGEIG
ncbi:hypothetical protein NC652_017125 [Populus alba x Populus x berolinensis]|nr:hypothetical protein NC652_017125 [Populus alba x Populus x berolinensis]